MSSLLLFIRFAGTIFLDSKTNNYPEIFLKLKYLPPLIRLFFVLTKGSILIEIALVLQLMLVASNIFVVKKVVTN